MPSFLPREYLEIGDERNLCREMMGPCWTDRALGTQGEDMQEAVHFMGQELWREVWAEDVS